MHTTRPWLRWAPWAALGLAPGCDAYISQAEQRARLDADRDGFIAQEHGGPDCDDTRASVHPDARERCNGRDDDCDGTTDQGVTDAPRWYVDLDGDGWTDPEPVQQCQQPASTATSPSSPPDCDDTDPLSYPTATELCDGADNDCNGSVDDDASDRSTVYLDADGDGHGDPNQEVLCCDCPEGYVSAGDDCDDQRADAYPGAPEVCDDGVDQDCSGVDAPCPVIDLGLVEAVVFGATEGPALAGGLATAGDWTAAAAPPQGGARGSVSRWSGPVSTNVGIESLADLQVLGAPDGTDGFGAALALLDPSAGGPWLAIGLPVASEAAGEVWLIAPDATGVQTEPAGVLRGGADAALGASLAASADLTGDGVADLLLGAPGADFGQGSAWVLPGPLSALPSLGDAHPLPGQEIPDAAGTVVAALGDLDGDGLADLAVSAPDRTAGFSLRGTIYVLHGPVTGWTDLSDASAAWVGTAEGDRAGQALCDPGDLDGDGLADLAIGVPLAQDGGAAFAVLGPATQNASLVDAWAGWTGAAAGDHAGQAVSALPGGGLAIAAPDQAQAGVIYLVDTPAPGVHLLADTPVQIDAAGPDHGAGTSLQPWSGGTDAPSHLLIGAPGATQDGREGAVWWWAP